MNSVEVSASSKVKIEVRTGNVGLEMTKMVGFTSPSNPTIQLRFYEEPKYYTYSIIE